MVSMQPGVSAAASLRGFVTSTIPWNSVQHARSICVDTTRIFKGAPTLFPAQCCHARSYATNVEKELLEAKREARPYRIDVSKLSAVEREKLRLRSKAIPLVADTDALDVIFEDDLFLVVNKPSFVKMHPSHRFQGGSLLNRAIGHCGFAPFILHRLDMHTTGVVVMSKQKKVCSAIMRQFTEGTVKKEYLCIVDGFLECAPGFSFSVDAPIQRHETVRFMRKTGTCEKDGKPAQTRYTILDKCRRKNMMLLRACPQTGRTHQIRVHASERNVPIVGDDLYNGIERNMYSSYEEISAASQNADLIRYGCGNALRKGLKLHAWKIELINPEDNTTLRFCAKPPDGMQKLMEWCNMALPASFV